MFQELINKQVVCPRLEVLQFMYPTFKVVKGDFEIYPDEPFIYVGDIRWINKIRKRTEPHIIVSGTGDYDLSNMDTLIDLAYKKHNKRKPQYVGELLESWETKSGKAGKVFTEDFIYNWKHLWVTGFIPNREIEQNTLFLDIVREMNNPFKVISLFLKASKQSDVKYLERNLLKFIESSMSSQDPSKLSNKSAWYQQKQQIFYSSYSRNVRFAMHQLLSTTNNEDLSLRTLSLLKDVTVGDKA